MKKGITLFLAGSMLLSVAGGWGAPVAHGAESKVKVIVNNAALKYPDDNTSYLDGSVVMVPARAAGETLGFEVRYIKQEDSLKLAGDGVQYTFKLKTGEVIINGSDKLALKGSAALKNNRVYVPLAWLEVLGLSTTYDAAAAQATVMQPQQIAENVLQLLSSGQFDVLKQQYFDDNLIKVLPVSALQQGWESVTSPLGSYVKLESAIATTEKNEMVIVSDALFSQGKLTVTMTVGSGGKLSGLSIAPPVIDAPSVDVPVNVTEEDLVIGEGTAHPLRAKLTMPRNAAQPLPAVVLVHGSGSTDLDETVLGNKPFRDIAYGLAEQGIAVLRYDKRTYAYPKEQVLTVKEETVDDAVAASNLLKQDKRIDASRVFVAGHSLGGMLAPRIDAAGGNFAGLILLAGSPRALWEVVYDQNMDILNGLADSDPLKAPNAALVAAELDKAKRLASMTDDEAQKAPSVFGMPAYYLREMDQHNTAELARGLQKPVLVLQGGDDFQVYPDKDFPLWKEVLKNNSAADFKLYPGLSHLFVDYDGPGAGTTAEYNVPGRVDSGVIADMGDWIKGLDE
ncbi:hypothetical protein C2I18_25085 [Paenibacillus sp. PK3_47]|uniref:alpha/beta fold hydrolase n=1 Tax=Paenibacillus sp. PK3_47 TaxID=2072642 RepID=UPI00201D4DD2|nr:alpha/beta fold hydrolase [Paenibacillus sp. PK3_47]UQZ36519.1 hypothetical protein C2I18_25085 [Paenibacillus sp. PK3_47]